jgi:hypothetical protein
MSTIIKVIAIDIDKAKAVFGVLLNDESGIIAQIKSEFNFVVLEDDKDSVGVKAFQTTVHNFFDEIKPDKIAILTRQMKGRFKAASVSFKIEALIQTYPEVNIEFVSPQALNAYYKKQHFDLQVAYKYQENALKLGCYLIRRELN